MRNDMMEANYQGLKKAYEANQTLQHDHKNHLLAVRSLIEEHNNEEALEYIKTFLDYNKRVLKGIKTGNNILDIIIDYKIDEARGKNITFEYDVEYVGELYIKDIDVCALMANLLDNAIEACEKIRDVEPWIDLKIYRRNHMFFIRLGNCFYPDKNKKAFFQTEKENKQLHGWGMKSIEGVIKKYGGNIEHEIHNKYINILINIPIENS